MILNLQFGKISEIFLKLATNCLIEDKNVVFGDLTPRLYLILGMHCSDGPVGGMTRLGRHFMLLFYPCGGQSCSASAATTLVYRSDYFYLSCFYFLILRK